MKNLTYCSAGQLSPLLNDPRYETIGIGTSVWLAGAHGHVYAEGTQFASICERGANGVPMEGAGTLALTGDMKKMRPEFVRGLSLKGYGVSLALGIGIPIPILNPAILKNTTVRDSQIMGSIVDYSSDYPERTGKILGRVSYADLRKGEVNFNGKVVEVSSLSSYYKALEVATILKDEIKRGDFQLSKPIDRFPLERGSKKLEIRDKD